MAGGDSDAQGSGPSMIELKEIREWPLKKRLTRLRELGRNIEEKWNQEQVPNNALLDEAVVIWLEIMRTAFPEASPLDKLQDLVDVYREPFPPFGLMSLRFMETKELIERFKGADRVERQRLRPTMMARGML